MPWRGWAEASWWVSLCTLSHAAQHRHRTRAGGTPPATVKVGVMEDEGLGCTCCGNRRKEGDCCHLGWVTVWPRGRAGRELQGGLGAHQRVFSAFINLLYKKCMIIRKKLLLMGRLKKKNLINPSKQLSVAFIDIFLG